MRFVLWIVAFLVCLSPPALAQIGSDYVEDERGDSRVRQALDGAGLSYTVDEDDDFKLVMSFSDEDRSQLVWVRSATNTVRGMEIREVWSPVYADDSGSLPDEIASWALQRSWELIAGSLASPGTGHVYYVVKVDANAAPGVLTKAVEIAASTGDDLEQEKSTGDEL